MAKAKKNGTKIKTNGHRNRVDDDTFIELWQKGGPSLVAEKTGLSLQAARVRAGTYKKHGAPMNEYPTQRGNRKDWAAIIAKAKVGAVKRASK